MAATAPKSSRIGFNISIGAMLNTALFVYAATLPVLTTAIPADLEPITPAKSTHNFKRSLIALDEHWCDGKIHPSQGSFKPTSAVCIWNEGATYKVYCETYSETATGLEGIYIESQCDAGLYCKQLEDVKIWSGLLTFDIDCVPSQGLVKWAIGESQKGIPRRQYCSNYNHYSTNKGANPVWEFFASFFNLDGQQTRINVARIFINSQLVAKGIDVNSITADHRASSTDLVQYCGIRGSDALIEGYAIARLKSFVNAAGEVVMATDDDQDFTVTEVTDEGVRGSIT